jgi:hypothetical protein
VERDLHPLTGDCVNGGTRRTKRKYLDTRYSSVRLLSSFLVTNENKVALPVVHRKKLWKARLTIMRILLFFDNTTGVNDVKAINN